jgi:hypothetical protein
MIKEIQTSHRGMIQTRPLIEGLICVFIGNQKWCDNVVWMEGKIDRMDKKNRIKLQYDFVPKDRYIYGYQSLEDQTVFTIKSPYLKVLKTCHQFKSKSYFIVALEQDLDADEDVERFIGKIRKMDDLSKECILKNAMKWYGKSWDIFTIDSMTRYPIDEQRGEFYMKLILPSDDGEYSKLYQKIADLEARVVESGGRDLYVSMTIYFRGIKWSRETFTEEWYLEDFTLLEEEVEDISSERASLPIPTLALPKEEETEVEPKMGAGEREEEEVDAMVLLQEPVPVPLQDIVDDSPTGSHCAPWRPLAQGQADDSPTESAADFCTFGAKKVEESSPVQEEVPIPMQEEESLETYHPIEESVVDAFQLIPEERKKEKEKKRSSKEKERAHAMDDNISLRSGKSLGSQRVKKIFHLHGKVLK